MNLSPFIQGYLCLRSSGLIADVTDSNKEQPISIVMVWLLSGGISMHKIIPFSKNKPFILETWSPERLQQQGQAQCLSWGSCTTKSSQTKEILQMHEKETISKILVVLVSMHHAYSLTNCGA